jgi:uncharacterized membrane protein YphA (DoxX/SURF4 family)
MADVSTGAPPSSRNSGKNVVAWILSVLVALEFLAAGCMKLIGNPQMVDVFAHVGLGQWFRYFTGVLEVLLAIGLLAPKRSLRAARLLMLVMLGAIIAHLTVLRGTPYSAPWAAVATLVLLFVIARLRRSMA